SLPTFYTVATAAGALLAGILFLLAPVIAAFYNSPQLVPIVQCLSVTLFLGGVRSVSQSLMTKHLLFQRLTIIEGICGLLSASVAVYLAWRGYGAWSLVINLVLASVLQTLVVTVAVRPKYTLRPDMAVVKKTLRWGTPMIGSSVLWKLYDNADYLIIGKLAGKEALGFYTVAFRLATLVNEKIGAVVSRVSFPTFAALQHDHSRVAAHWFSITRKSALVSFPILTMLIVAAEDIVGVLLGAKWLPSVHLLRLLCIVGALRVLTPVTINLLPALGRSDLAFRYTLMNAIFMPASFFLACVWNGPTGVAFAWLLVFPSIALYLIHHALRLTGTHWTPYVKNLRLPMLSSIALAAGMAPALLFVANAPVRLIISALCGGAAFLMTMLASTEGRALLPQQLLRLWPRR
ncbi:MAG TPA: lipopolysaccharide biosynthesis protein, partial [Candidatus Angelobacter sp.]|nr:lipopolysaccharide biosynthesis protein [Candidatus Angelobacter sp.]